MTTQPAAPDQDASDLGRSARDSARKPTIREVAKLAGVSHQTVSRYLIHAGVGMREPIQERIRQAISELGYRPNLAARAMRTQRTGQLAILLPSGPAHSSVEVLHGATETARAAGYDVDVLTLGGSARARSQRALELVESSFFEGVLALTSLELDAQERPGGTPIVEVGLYDWEMHGTGLLADGSAVRELIQHLAELGHRRFLHVAGAFTHESARRRRQAYLSAIDEFGLDDYGVAECDWLPERAMQTILDLPDDHGVTAVIAANDALAAAVVRGAMLRGLEVPRDLSVTGFDVQGLSAWLNPSLTSVQVDHELLGAGAMHRLLEQLTGSPPVAEESVFTVVWGDSIGPAPQALKPALVLSAQQTHLPPVRQQEQT